MEILKRKLYDIQHWLKLICRYFPLKLYVVEDIVQCIKTAIQAGGSRVGSRALKSSQLRTRQILNPVLSVLPCRVSGVSLRVEGIVALLQSAEELGSGAGGGAVHEVEDCG